MGEGVLLERNTLSRCYTPTSRRWGESEAALFRVREDSSYVRASRGRRGRRRSPRMQADALVWALEGGSPVRSAGSQGWWQVPRPRGCQLIGVAGQVGGVEGGGSAGGGYFGKPSGGRLLSLHISPLRPRSSTACFSRSPAQQRQRSRQTSRFPCFLHSSLPAVSHQHLVRDKRRPRAFWRCEGSLGRRAPVREGLTHEVGG